MDNLDVLIISRDNGLISQICRYLYAWKKRHAVYSNSLHAISHISQISASAEKPVSGTLIIDGHDLDQDPGKLAMIIKNKLGLADLKLLYLLSPDDEHSALDMQKHGYHDAFNPQDAVPQLLKHLLNENTSSDSNNIIPLSGLEFDPQQESSAKAILLAEHEIGDRKELEKALRNVGHKVVSVDDGDQALEALEHRSFDLAIINLDLPVMNGTQVIRLHRFTTPHNQQVPFIMIANNKTANSMSVCRDLKVTGCLFKPALESEVLDVIDTCFSLNETQRQSESGDKNRDYKRNQPAETTTHQNSIMPDSLELLDDD